MYVGWHLQASVGHSCLGRLTSCSQRLIAVFENIADGVTNLICDNNICQKHLLAADKDEQVLCVKNYVSPRKLRI